MSEQTSSESVARRRHIVRAVLRTDVGLVRSENQDFGTYTTAAEEQSSHTGGRLLIVADGMGGHRGGATASRLAAETVKAQYLGSETSDVPRALRESLIRANARIFSEAQSNPELRGMGTTTSVLAVRGEEGWIAHVGDSRIYRVREEAIEQLTDDHSLVATMVREGLLTSAEAEIHPRRNVLQRSMGVSEDVEVDVIGPLELRTGDTFILCSDGLHGLVKEPELKEIARMPIDAAADEFLRRALERGAPDNVTVIVARVEEGDGEEPPIERPEKLEETQPLEVLDETVRETQKLPIVTTEIPAPMAAAPAAIAVPAAQSVGDDTQKSAPAATSVGDVTQKSAPPAATSVDDTLKTTLPPANIGDDTRKSHPPGKIPALKTTPGTSRTPVVKAARRKSPVLRWTLVVVLVLSAVGAWLYWNDYLVIAKEPGTTSSR